MASRETSRPSIGSSKNATFSSFKTGDDSKFVDIGITVASPAYRVTIKRFSEGKVVEKSEALGSSV